MYFQQLLIGTTHLQIQKYPYPNDWIFVFFAQKKGGKLPKISGFSFSDLHNQGFLRFVDEWYHFDTYHQCFALKGSSQNCHNADLPKNEQSVLSLENMSLKTPIRTKTNTQKLSEFGLTSLKKAEKLQLFSAFVQASQTKLAQFLYFSLCMYLSAFKTTDICVFKTRFF